MTIRSHGILLSAVFILNVPRSATVALLLFRIVVWIRKYDSYCCLAK